MAMHITEVCKDVAKEYLKTETSRLSRLSTQRVFFVKTALRRSHHMISVRKVSSNLKECRDCQNCPAASTSPNATFGRIVKWAWTASPTLRILRLRRFGKKSPSFGQRNGVDHSTVLHLMYAYFGHCVSRQQCGNVNKGDVESEVIERTALHFTGWYEQISSLSHAIFNLRQYITVLASSDSNAES